MRVSNQTADQIDTEIGKATMTSVFNLGNVLELVDDGFHDCSLALQEFVSHIHQPVFHIGLELGDELDALLPKLLKESLRQVAFVPKQFAKQALNQLGDWATVIDVAGGETTRQQFTIVVHHQMQFEAKKPVH